MIYSQELRLFIIDKIFWSSDIGRISSCLSWDSFFLSRNFNYNNNIFEFTIWRELILWNIYLLRELQESVSQCQLWCLQGKQCQISYPIDKFKIIYNLVVEIGRLMEKSIYLDYGLITVIREEFDLFLLLFEHSTWICLSIEIWFFLNCFFFSFFFVFCLGFFFHLAFFFCVILN